MTIAICGSMQFHQEMREIKKILEGIGHIVSVPMGDYEGIPVEARGLPKEELIAAKIEYDFIRKNFKNIEQADAVLVLNYPKKNIEGYIGGNTFLEMGYGFGLGKKIFALFPLPVMEYEAEMHAMQPMILNGDLGKIG
jgi:nucleoside 2-deoxyribosyltransferase